LQEGKEYIINTILIDFSSNETGSAIMKYKVNIKKAEEGYSIWCPGLPGCWSQGKNEEEALENIKDAIKAYLDTMEDLCKNEDSRYVEVA